MSLTLLERSANVSIFTATLLLLVLLGGGTYEAMSVSRVVASAPPASLAMLQGPYGFRPILFWATIHPATILFTILALALNWRLSRQRRTLLLVVLMAEVVIRLFTLLYFAPEAGYISSVEFSNTVDSALRDRAQQWERWNLLRLSSYVGASIAVLLALNTPIRSRRVAT